MEVVLEKAEGVPEGGVLSIKFGDTKRQAPASKIGQPFRFACSTIEPMPIQVELLVPVAPAQAVRTDPVAERFEVDFGGGKKVVLRQRLAAELAPPTVDVKGAAEARGMAPEKVVLAQKAAAYLEEHDLVRIFQDTLHALLINKPADPHAYIEERLSRAKQLAAKPKVGSQEPAATTAASAADRELDNFGEPDPADAANDPPPARRARGGHARSSIRESVRGSMGSRSKVDTLLMTLQCAHDNLQLVLPFIPDELRDMVTSDKFAEECSKHFTDLDTKKRGKLSDADLLPVIQHLSSANLKGIGADQCRKFVDMFDSDDDGLVNREDFFSLVQFVIVASYLESPEGKEIIELAHVEQNHFNDFMRMIEGDKERLWAIIPFLPEWLVEHVTSQEFQDSCNARFTELDADSSGSLEPGELIPVIQQLSQAHPLTIDIEKCRQFTRLFDVHGNGVIMRDEFIEFAQFLTVMNFLAHTDEGKQIQKQAEIETASVQTQMYIGMLELDPQSMIEVRRHLPQAFVAELWGAAYEETCSKAYVSLDPDSKNAVTFSRLFPTICLLSTSHPFQVSEAQCRSFADKYDTDGKGSVSKEGFPDFARYIIVMAYLQYAKEHQEMLCADVLLGQEKISKLLSALSEGVDAISGLIPFLPAGFLDELLSDAFVLQCNQDFKELDKDDSGVLEPSELLPVILSLAEAHHFSLTSEHSRHFVDIFDSERNGVITKGEYVNFVRFMMIMSFMETEEGKRVEMDKTITQGQEAVEELLLMLEQDRKAVHKVIPLLPQDIYNELTSDAFVKSCHDRFIELDQDKTGVLRPHELYPVVVELSAAHPYAVSEEQCKRFTRIFDIHGDGVLRPDEFLDFTRFLCIMSYLHTSDGKSAAKDALQIMADSKKIEELLVTMEQDRHHINKVIPYLPDWLRDDLLSEHFTLECLTYFQDLDKDGNGSLEPEELFPMVLSLSQAHQQSLDIDQCRRFTAIFDDAKTGVISRSEFVNFSRFLIVMGFLKSQEGQKVAEAAVEGSKRKNGKDAPGQLAIEAAPSSSTALAVSPRQRQAEGGAAPTSPAHLQVDCEYYQKKSDKLTAENDELRQRLHRLEELVRKMEDKVDAQDQKLRHAEVDLRASGAMR